MLTLLAIGNLTIKAPFSDHTGTPDSAGLHHERFPFPVCPAVL